MKNKRDLIAQISQNLGGIPPAVAPPVKTESAKMPARAALQSGSRGRTVQPSPEGTEAADAPCSTGSGKQAAFWLDDEDRAIFHETGMLLYTQGIKPSHNLILRAAIRMIPRDHRLVEKIRELIEKDGRKVRHQKK